MPLYEYECGGCGRRFELIQKFSDPAPDACTRCGKGPVRRLQSSPAIQFKGTGWYITDYAQKGKSNGGTAGTSESKGETKTDAGDTKSATAKSESTGTAPAGGSGTTTSK